MKKTQEINLVPASIRLGLFLQKNIGESLPEIRYFDGLDCFCTANCSYKGKTLEESLEKFLKEKKF